MKTLNSNNKNILDEIFLVINKRADELKVQSLSKNNITDNPKIVSYTQKLMLSGIERVSQKLGEEAVETVIASLKGTKQDIIAESSDLLYHLLVLWKMSNISPDEVYNELAKRNKLLDS